VHNIVLVEVLDRSGGLEDDIPGISLGEALHLLYPLKELPTSHSKEEKKVRTASAGGGGGIGGGLLNIHY